MKHLRIPIPDDMGCEEAWSLMRDALAVLRYDLEDSRRAHHLVAMLPGVFKKKNLEHMLRDMKALDAALAQRLPYEEPAGTLFDDLENILTHVAAVATQDEHQFVVLRRRLMDVLRVVRERDTSRDLSDAQCTLMSAIQLHVARFI
jgi:hypothetical protein